MNTDGGPDDVGLRKSTCQNVHIIDDFITEQTINTGGSNEDVELHSGLEVIEDESMPVQTNLSFVNDDSRESQGDII